MINYYLNKSEKRRSFIKEAQECEERWKRLELLSSNGFIRATTAVLLESHRLISDCQECGERASYSRRNPSFEYFCSEHAPEDASCFILEEYRDKYK